MPMEVWFPLAIYHNDLPDAEKYNPAMRQTMLDMEEQAGEHRYQNTAWTGDIHGISGVHDDPRFAWLTAQVEENCVQYLSELGYDMDKIDLFIQRSWPVISRKDEGVGVHAHYNANISAVYYVDVPKDLQNEDDAGVLVMHNMANPNEMQKGIASTATDAIANWNEFNYQSVNYPPVADRLLMFPAKQDHSVEPNKTDELRLSIAFDIVLAAAQHQGKETTEFLPPPPTSWRRMNR